MTKSNKLLLIGIGVLVGMALAIHDGRAQTPTPLPIVKRSAWQEPYGPEEAAKPPQQRSQYGDWRRFQGATQCTQTPDGVLTCDNGYKGRGR